MLIQQRILDVIVVGNESKISFSVIEQKKQNVYKTKLLLHQCRLGHIMKMNLTESEKKEVEVTGMVWRGMSIIKHYAGLDKR